MLSRTEFSNHNHNQLDQMALNETIVAHCLSQQQQLVCEKSQGNGCPFQRQITIKVEAASPD
jgi:hypothetical protein